MTDTAFDQEAFLHAYPDGIDRGFWFIARNRIVARFLRSLAAPPARVLDIGCGRGFSVKALCQAGWDARGVDLGRPEPLPDVANRLMLGEDAFEIPGRECYEALTLLDVIEHIEDAPAFLRRCRESFSQALGILVSVPARRELWSNYDERYGHFRRYDIGMLASEAAAAGLRLEYWSYAFHALYLSLRLNLALGRDRAVVLKAPRHPLPHRVLGFALDAEQRLLPRGYLGTSLFAILKPV